VVFHYLVEGRREKHKKERVLRIVQEKIVNNINIVFYIILYVIICQY
jgi:hypothetical protein